MFKKNRKSKSGKQRTGSVCVEFALISPIFFLVTLASVEFARVHMLQSAAENACFEGARRGIVPGATNSACQATTENLLRVAGIQDFVVEVTPTTIDATADIIDVKATIPITSENNFLVSAFFRGRSIVKEISIPRQSR